MCAPRPSRKIKVIAEKRASIVPIAMLEAYIIEAMISLCRLSSYYCIHDLSITNHLGANTLGALTSTDAPLTAER